MEIIYECCCGLDVHAKTVVACLIKRGKKEIRTFSTMTDELLALSDWLVSEGCTHVAMESRGVYWKPVFNVLEGVLEVILVNARHVKAVPGGQTDVRDCEWLADWLRHGLLKASFIPPAHIRDLRELTRYRQSLVTEQTAVANRIQKLFESANIKLGQVASDALGVSGLAILRALAGGETDAEKMAALARRRLRMGKKKALVAVGHSILVIVSHILKRGVSYEELGGDYFDRQNVEAQRARLIRKLEALGLKVTVQEVPAAA